MTTTNLKITEMSASQAQKHVTFNEALFVLDSLVQIKVADKDLTSPPLAPALGDSYLVASVASGSWLGKESNIAVYDGAGWVFHAPNNGWKCWVDDEATEYTFNTSWAPTETKSKPVQSPNGASMAMRILEEEITAMAGATVATTIAIPARCVLQAVSVRVTTGITGATSFDCGPTGGAPGGYGGLLGVSAGSTNIGVIGPTAFYTPTTITLTANGGAFTAGAVRVAIQYLELTAPGS